MDTTDEIESHPSKRIGKFDPRQVDKILRMKEKQVAHYVEVSRRKWAKGTWH